MEIGVKFEYGDGFSAQWSGATGVTLAFTPEGERMSYLGCTWNYEEARNLVAEFFGGEPSREERYSAGFNIFPFP